MRASVADDGLLCVLRSLQHGEPSMEYSMVLVFDRVKGRKGNVGNG
jgi:hypothetical protein